MMISRQNWTRFLLLSIIGIVVWWKFTLPQFSFIDLSVDQPQALEIARKYLRERGIPPQHDRHALNFFPDGAADQYLQKSIGFHKEIEFLKKFDYHLFQWSVRFFNEHQKEQYYVTLSASTGEIVSFNHVIEDMAARPFRGQSASREKVVAFLRENLGFRLEDYIEHSQLTNKFDNRTEYNFSWEHKDVFIPWHPDKTKGGAKLLIGATISGDEILSFYKQGLLIPDEFNRDLARRSNVGQNLSVLFRILFFTLLTASIFFVVIKRNDLVMHSAKGFALRLTGLLFLLHVGVYLNDFETVIFNYPTTSSFASYYWQYAVSVLMDSFIVAITILMPILAGEAMRYETLPDHKNSSFLHYILSTFWSRNVFQLILLGYLVCIIQLGIQTVMFEIGQRYWHVWSSYSWMTQLSTSYLPFLAALTIGISAGFSEEITFRLFSISFFKKFSRNIWAAVLFSAVIWGYGHSSYPVFPMWFRGLEVTIMGLFLSYIYLRYGIIPVIVAHYLFDVFWSSAGYLIGTSTPYLFFSSLAIICLPLAMGIAAFILNRPETERDMRWCLTKHQQYNRMVLKHYLAGQKVLENKSSDELSRIKQEIHSHGWDLAVVEIAFEDILGTGKGT